MKIHRILFVCHGNICRSPMAEFIMKKMCGGSLDIGSAATSSEETGNRIYPPAAAKLHEKGIPFDRYRTARRMTMEDYLSSDMVIVMDRMNLRNARHMTGGDPKGRISLMMDYTERPGSEVSDPWYTGDFERAYRDIEEGCRGLLRHIESQRP